MLEILQAAACHVQPLWLCTDCSNLQNRVLVVTDYKIYPHKTQIGVDFIWPSVLISTLHSAQSTEHTADLLQ